MSYPEAAAALVALLQPYADPDRGQGNRFLGVPPATASQVLELLPADLAAARLNLTQPPMSWLTTVAAELNGRLVGSLVPGRAFARIDGIQVDASAARELATRVAAAWPAITDIPAALASATGEAWTSWSADAEPVWTGAGESLLTEPLPHGAAVAGLWWD